MKYVTVYVLGWNIMEYKSCTKCGEVLPNARKFFHFSKKCRNGLRSICIKCRHQEYKKTSKQQNKVSRKYYKQNSEKIKNHLLKKYYSISLKQYNKMVKVQKECCAICGKHQSKLKKALGVDHNHKTGKVRKLLCDHCNLTLGHFEKYRKQFNNYLEVNDE